MTYPTPFVLTPCGAPKGASAAWRVDDSKGRALAALYRLERQRHSVCVGGEHFDFESEREAHVFIRGLVAYRKLLA